MVLHVYIFDIDILLIILNGTRMLASLASSFVIVLYCLTYEEEKHEETQLSHGGFECPSQDLQSFGVPGQLENSEHSH